MDWLHHVLNLVLFSPNSDLAWAAVRAVTAIASINAAWALRYHSRFPVFWAVLFLGVWIGLKVLDDITHPGVGPQLTLYFALSNLAWVIVLVALSRIAQRNRYTALGRFGGQT